VCFTYLFKSNNTTFDECTQVRFGRQVGKGQGRHCAIPAEVAGVKCRDSVIEGKQLRTQQASDISSTTGDHNMFHRGPFSPTKLIVVRWCTTQLPHHA